MEKPAVCRKCGAARDSKPFSKWTNICKECIAKYDHGRLAANLSKIVEQNRKYRLDHPERYRQWQRNDWTKNRLAILERKKKWYEANPEKRKERAQRDYQTHGDRRRAAKRKDYATTPDKFKQRVRNYRKANPKKVKETASKFYSAHKEVYFSLNHRRRARVLNNGVEKYSFADIIRRDNGICHICGKKVSKKEQSRDHLIPISQGGPDAPWNVALAHRSCNSRRGPGRIPAQLLLRV